MPCENVFVLSSGETVPVIIETRRGARNVTLRPKTAPEFQIHISKPWTTSNVFVLKFLESKRKWIENIFARAPKKQKLSPGVTVEFLGRIVQIVHDEKIHGNKYLNTDKTVLCIGGGIDMFERRVRDYIKDDTTSRWGSCSSNGNMSFSWRLAFAPYDVMRYVVMHELAHTKHMDHSAEFWATVSQLYGFGVERAKRWLTKNGTELHKYF